LENDPQQQVLELFQKVHGCGPNVAATWYAKGMRTLDDLRHRTDLNDQQRIGLEFFDDFQKRIPRDEMQQFLDIVKDTAYELDPKLDVYAQGSFRRGAPDCGDADMIITHTSEVESERLTSSHRLVDRLKKDGIITHDLSYDRATIFLGAGKLPGHETHRRIDLLFVPYDRLGAALLHFTGRFPFLRFVHLLPTNCLHFSQGNDIFNRSLRALAKRKGLTLSQDGLYEALRGARYSETVKGKLIAAKFEVGFDRWARSVLSY
jgi:DNA polymerase/3'-5' exonuclease PolX